MALTININIEKNIEGLFDPQVQIITESIDQEVIATEAGFMIIAEEN